jgi:hypothetical protein
VTTYDITRRPASDNWKNGRAGWDPDVITIHVTQGEEHGTRSHFNNPKTDASTHYHVTEEGKLDQFVDEDDTAFGNGIVVRPTAAIVLERKTADGKHVNPNLYTISIEHEGRGDREMTDAQRAASLWLVTDIIRRRPKIRPDRRHIIGHHEIRANKACPGAISVDRFVRELRASMGLDGAAAQPAPMLEERPEVLWSPSLGWIITTRVVSDTEWHFVKASDLGTGKAAPILRAGARLSAVRKLSPPGLIR